MRKTRLKKRLERLEKQILQTLSYSNSEGVKNIQSIQSKVNERLDRQVTEFNRISPMRMMLVTVKNNITGLQTISIA